MKKTKKPTLDRTRPFSWSAISSFMYDKEQWYRKYILGIKDPPSIEMLFGNVVGERLAKDPEYLPKVPRYSVFEKKFEASISGIPIIGFLDSYCPDTVAIHEYKTASSKTKWNKKSVQEHGQLKFYKLLIWINTGVIPEKVKCHLTWIPVRKVGGFKEGFSMELSDQEPQTFEAKHTSADILEFGNFIKKTYAEMLKYAENHR